MPTKEIQVILGDTKLYIVLYNYNIIQDTIVSPLGVKLIFYCKFLISSNFKRLQCLIKLKHILKF